MSPRLIEAITNNWALKLTSLAVAFLLWGAVKAEVPERVRLSDVPVRVVNRDADWVVAAPAAPSTVEIEFSGPTRELLRFAVQSPEVLVPIDEVTDSSEIRVLRTGWVQLYGGMDNTRVEDIRPSTVQLHFDRVVSDLVPVTVRVIGTPAQGYELAGPIEVEPSALRASGAASVMATLDSLRLGPIDLSGWATTDTFPLGVDTVGLGVMVTPTTVRLVVPVRPVQDTAARGRPGAPRPDRRP